MARTSKRIDECFDLYEDEYNREWDSDDEQMAEEVRRKGAFIIGNGNNDEAEIEEEEK